ncbi:hypothetical protein yruck0001_5600 [Yersinia ruckeri ATCC 29473]|uniref:Uncharacterized protein n=1 Tax=Yersinia ruckeri TaxID=29486 RepID=A0A0A8VJR2_YERRU|nr:hypothetical protein yruck0001_5600 [Yersinia ruckeri ATCC 29473]CEK28618.1 hypothetical protein CSF007_14465 [Yersinia ruckeri]
MILFLPICALAASHNEQDLIPIYPQIYGITRLKIKYWFNLQP